MGIFRLLLCALAALSASGIAAANNEADSDGFVWIDANTRIKVKPVSAGGGATAPEKAPQKTSKTAGKKEKPAK